MTGKTIYKTALLALTLALMAVAQQQQQNPNIQHDVYPVRSVLAAPWGPAGFGDTSPPGVLTEFREAVRYQSVRDPALVGDPCGCESPGYNCTARARPVVRSSQTWTEAWNVSTVSLGRFHFRYLGAFFAPSPLSVLVPDAGYQSAYRVWLGRRSPVNWGQDLEYTITLTFLDGENNGQWVITKETRECWCEYTPSGSPSACSTPYREYKFSYDYYIVNGTPPTRTVTIKYRVGRTQHEVIKDRPDYINDSKTAWRVVWPLDKLDSEYGQGRLGHFFKIKVEGPSNLTAEVLGGYPRQGTQKIEATVGGQRVGVYYDRESRNWNEYWQVTTCNTGTRFVDREKRNVKDFVFGFREMVSWIRLGPMYDEEFFCGLFERNVETNGGRLDIYLAMKNVYWDSVGIDNRLALGPTGALSSEYPLAKPWFDQKRMFYELLFSPALTAKVEVGEGCTYDILNYPHTLGLEGGRIGVRLSCPGGERLVPLEQISKMPHYLVVKYQAGGQTRQVRVQIPPVGSPPAFVNAGEDLVRDVQLVSASNTLAAVFVPLYQKMKVGDVELEGPFYVVFMSLGDEIRWVGFREDSRSMLGLASGWCLYIPLGRDVWFFRQSALFGAGGT